MILFDLRCFFLVISFSVHLSTVHIHLPFLAQRQKWSKLDWRSWKSHCWQLLYLFHLLLLHHLVHLLLQLRRLLLHLLLIQLNAKFRPRVPWCTVPLFQQQNNLNFWQFAEIEVLQLRVDPVIQSSFNFSQFSFHGLTTVDCWRPVYSAVQQPSLSWQ